MYTLRFTVLRASVTDRVMSTQLYIYIFYIRFLYPDTSDVRFSEKHVMMNDHRCVNKIYYITVSILYYSTYITILLYYNNMFFVHAILVCSFTHLRPLIRELLHLFMQIEVKHEFRYQVILEEAPHR